VKHLFALFVMAMRFYFKRVGYTTFSLPSATTNPFPNTCLTIFSVQHPFSRAGLHSLRVLHESKSGPEGLEATRRQRNIMDFTFGIIFPVVNTLLDFIISPARYAIMGVYGCTGLNSQTWPQVPLFSLWSLILAFTAAVYACMCCVVRY
jgi:sterol desaturase/sphingolipid hydroxylase (fatty acid hydroxylase superfamily)